MPQGQYPTITAGADYTASLIQAFSPSFGWKTSTTTYSSTTLTNDADLLAANLAANAYYEYKAVLFYETATSGDPGVKTAFYGPAGATWYTAVLSQIVAGESVQVVTIVGTGSFDLHCAAVSTTTGAILEGTLTTGSGTGTFGLQFAENTSGDSVSLQPGSRLKVVRMA